MSRTHSQVIITAGSAGLQVEVREGEVELVSLAGPDGPVALGVGVVGQRVVGGGKSPRCSRQSPATSFEVEMWLNFIITGFWGLRAASTCWNHGAWKNPFIGIRIWVLTDATLTFWFSFATSWNVTLSVESTLYTGEGLNLNKMLQQSKIWKEQMVWRLSNCTLTGCIVYLPSQMFLVKGS